MKPQAEDYQKAVYLLNQAFAKTIPSKRQLSIRSFLQGLFFGLGTSIGVSIVLAVLTFTLNQLKLIPVFDTVIRDTGVEQILKTD